MTGVLFLDSWLSLWKPRRLHKLWANPVSPSKNLYYQKLGENLLGEQKSGSEPQGSVSAFQALALYALGCARHHAHAQLTFLSCSSPH